MQTLRDTAIQVLNNSVPNYDAAREVVGQFLHLLQMFYSNTNWIEMSRGGVIYQPLGMSDCCRTDKQNVLSPSDILPTSGTATGMCQKTER